MIILIALFPIASVTPLRSRGLRTLPIFRQEAETEIKILIGIEKPVVTCNKRCNTA